MIVAMGIDPGYNGAVALQIDPVKPKMIVLKTPREYSDIKELISRVLNKLNVKEVSHIYCMLEVVGTWASDAKVPGKNIQIAKLIEHFAYIRIALLELHITFELVPSMTWQTRWRDHFIASNTAGKGRREIVREWSKIKKNNFKEHAIEYCKDMEEGGRLLTLDAKSGKFKPSKVCLWNADAILLAMLSSERIYKLGVLKKKGIS